MVGFFDNNLSIPDIETYIYVGKSVLPSDISSEQEKWYFQDPEMYIQKGAFNESQKNDGSIILRVDREMLELIYDLDGLIDLLNEINP